MSSATNPEYYKSRGGVEPIEYITSNKLSFLEGQVVKYLHRYPFKGKPKEDLEKARQYLDWLIEELEVVETPFGDIPMCGNCFFAAEARVSRRKI